MNEPIDAYLDSIDDGETCYSDEQIVEEACRNPRKRATVAREIANPFIAPRVCAICGLKIEEANYYAETATNHKYHMECLDNLGWSHEDLRIDTFQLPTTPKRETLNTVDLAIRNEYELHRENAIEGVEIAQQAPQREIDTPARRLLDAQCRGYNGNLEMAATMNEMHQFMEAFSKTYRCADKVTNVLNMGLWNGKGLR
jgi:hypothetical protein